jgi:hypothetical protein
LQYMRHAEIGRSRRNSVMSRRERRNQKSLPAHSVSSITLRSGS